MHKSIEDKFVNESLVKLQNAIAVNVGVFPKSMEKFRDLVVDVGKAYHEYMKREEL